MSDSENESRAAPERKSVLRNALAAIDVLQGKIDGLERAKHEPIAIVGLSCRLPGAPSQKEYWKLLTDGKNAVKEVPADRWPREAFYDPDPSAPGKIHAPYGGFLDNLGLFDAAFFGISGREAESLDPQQRLLLEVAWESIENAGIAPDSLRGSDAGVFVGITTSDYARLSADGDPADLDVYSATGGALNAAAGRLSFVFGLTGPSIAIDTACSSSLVALHLACQSLRSRECSAALAGGVNVLLTPEPFVCFAKWGMMSADGRCKTFDEAADGFVRAEGCGIVVLKRLGDAQAAGDRILALITGTAVNQDGASSGLTVPNGLAQQAVIRAALNAAHLQAHELDYVEAHGTGTTLGDPIELEAIAAVLGRDRSSRQPLMVGSVKTNIGHAESASGIAGLIKIVLAMQHDCIPPHLNFRKLSSRISLGNAAIEIPVRNVPWPRSLRPRVAGVSSFGFSGTNAHAILQEAPLPPTVTSNRHSRSFNLLVLSAKSEVALQSLAGEYASFLKDTPRSALPDICHTAAVGRSALPHRLALVFACDDSQSAVNLLRSAAAGVREPRLITGRAKPGAKIAFVFSGDYSWSDGTGRSFYKSETVFRTAFDRCAVIFNQKNEVPLAQLIGYEAMGTVGPISHPEPNHAHPALFAYEYALASLWRSWGIEPSAVVGHGFGEIIAACIAGIITVEDAMRFVILRSRLLQEMPLNGAMAEIIAGDDRVSSTITSRYPSVAVAAINGPRSTIISGKAEEISALVTEFRSADLAVHPIPTRQALNSPLMQPILSRLRELAASMPHRAPKIDIALNATGKLMDDSSSMDPSYWCRNSREPLLYAQSIRSLRERGITRFVEIGPGGGLPSPESDPELLWLPSVRSSGNEWADILSSLGALFVSGSRPDWHACDRPYSRTIVDVPLYPFQRKFFWLEKRNKPVETRQSKAIATGSKTSGHPLLNARRLSPLPEAQFTCNLDLNQWPVLKEHRVAGMTLFPAAGFIELATHAGCLVLDGDFARIERGWLRTALILDESNSLEVHLIVTPIDEYSSKFEVYSQTRGSPVATEWRSHAGGMLVRGASKSKSAQVESMATAQSRCGTSVDIENYQRGMAEVGLDYGPSFRALKTAFRGERESFGMIQLPADDKFHTLVSVHPGVLDAAFHLIGIALGAGKEDLFYLPVGYEAAEIIIPAGADARAHVRLRDGNATKLIADVTVWSPVGHPAVYVRGLQVRAISRGQFRDLLGVKQNSGLLKIAWRPTSASGARPSSAATWIIIGGRESLAKAIDQKLCALGIVPKQVKEMESGDWGKLVQSEVSFGSGGIIDLRALHLSHDSRIPSEAFAAGAGVEILRLLRSLAENQPPSGFRLVIPTRCAQAVKADEVVNPLASTLWGLAATVMVELPSLDVRMIDLDDSADGASAIVDTALRQDDESRLAVRDEKKFAARLTSVDSADADSLVVPNETYGLFMRDRGSLSGLQLKGKPRQAPGEGCVEIEVMASGLNFRDVLNLLDMYPGPAGTLGNECCGRIVAVGAGVTGQSIGDLVTCIAEATFSSHVVAQAALVFPVPAEMSIAQAAVFPIAQLTAYLALFRVGKIKKGDRVLIHAAAGGVGLAAVHLALSANALVFATAGSDEKRHYLRTLGVADVFDSRQTLTAATVRAATGGHGVDLLLNSLTGEFIDEGLRSLAPAGRFLEIGLRELRTPEQVRAIRGDVTYHPLLLGDHCRDDPHFVRAMYDEVVALLQARIIPAPRTRAFPLAQAEAAFRHMAKAHHVGRIALMHPAARQSKVRNDGAYLVTGGLGAIGLHLAEWLADKGAVKLILLGRSAPSESSRARVEQLRARGVEIELIQGDVSNPKDLAFICAPRRAPIRGILHAAGIVDDAILAHVDTARFLRAMKPKADGAFNLAQALLGVELDFLIFFSSGSSILGSPGQAAYAAANAYLDGLACRLRGGGLAAIAINWGAWRDGGMAARLDKKTIGEWEKRGIGTVSLPAARDVLEAAIAVGLPQVAALFINWPVFFQSLPASRSGPFLSELGDSPLPGKEIHSNADATGKKDRLLNLSPSERVKMLTSQLVPIVAAVLGLTNPKDLDLEVGLTEQGMDSLTAVELRNRLQSELGLVCPVDRLLSSPTPLQLAKELLLQFATPDHTVGSTAAAVTEGEI